MDADSKTVQQRQFVGQLKHEDGINADGLESIFILTI